MSNAQCDREDELLEALQASRWPEACAQDLRDHVTACAVCADLLAVAAPLLSDQRALVEHAPVPSSAIVWWRAQMRSRREAAEKAAQPISMMFGVAVACAAGLLATLLGIFVPTFRRAFGWAGEKVSVFSEISWAVPADPMANPIAMAVAAAVGLCLLLGPIALYYAFRED